MTIESRARQIADLAEVSPAENELLRTRALQHLREAVDEALTRAGREILSHADWVGL